MEITHNIIKSMFGEGINVVYNIFNSDIFIFSLCITFFIIGEYFLIKTFKDPNKGFINFMFQNLILLLWVCIVMMVIMVFLINVYIILKIFCIVGSVIGFKYLLYRLFIKGIKK